MLLDVLKRTPASIPRRRLDLLLNATWYKRALDLFTVEFDSLISFFQLFCLLRYAKHDGSPPVKSSSAALRANGLGKNQRNGPMLGVTGEDFSLARVRILKTPPNYADGRTIYLA